MVQAYQKEIVLPNKHVTPKESFWDGHLLDAETYVGGHVEEHRGWRVPIRHPRELRCRPVGLRRAHPGTSMPP